MPSASADSQNHRRAAAVRLLASATFALLAVVGPAGSLAGTASSTKTETRSVAENASWRHGSAFMQKRPARAVARASARGQAGVRSWRALSARPESSERPRIVRWAQAFTRGKRPKPSDRSATPVTTPPGARPSPAPPTGGSPVHGVSSNADRFAISVGGHVHNFGAAELARELDGYRAVGARWIRVDINWHVIQAAGPQSFNWAPFDNVVRGARDRGINVLGLLVYTPPWARNGAGDPAYPPSRTADYAAFAAQAVRHYAPMGVRHWEIWNEPNIPEFWKSGPNAAAYTELLRAAYPAIKQADPGATVVSAGLSGYGAYGALSADGRINPLTFLERMYAAGASGHFDALGYHPYSFPGGLAFHPASGWSQMVDTTPSVRSIMSANGDGGKQVWATEFGAPTRGGSEAMTEEQLAKLVTDSYRVFGSYGWAGPLFWYSFRDLGSSGTNRDLFFGLLRNDFSPKPAYAAYQQAAVEARR